MNGIQNRKTQNIEEPFPGCLGRMVNLFDLGNGVAGSRLLMDKPHCDGSPISRSKSDVARMLSAPFGDQIEDKMIVSELRRSSSNKKANGTPMKTLIAQEMSREVESKHNPPNLVAKLMGLDTLPNQEPVAPTQRSHSRGYSRRSLSHSGILEECWDQDHSFLDKRMAYQGWQRQEQNECKDVFEIWQQSQRTRVRDGSPTKMRDSSPQKGSYNENVNEKRMALVRQKFMEAKRLSTDEKGRQSKEFQEALEILSSNKDLFLRLLQEPSSLFSQHLYDLQSIPQSPETKRITVLRPSKVVDNEKIAGSGKRSDEQIEKQAHMAQATECEKTNPGYSPTFSNQRINEYPAQPTRIVVLKPSPGKIHDIKAVLSPPSSSPRMFKGEDFYDEPEDGEDQESREVAKEITRHMRENLMGLRRDETLLSSVYSNGYTGDDSSFNKSENDYAAGNLSDTEIMSPASRHSWDYINRFGSPYSSSSFSRASCSPESSVCREAKKRLSERWAMMTSNGRSQELKNGRRSSSTLGEMLALSDTKKSVRTEEDFSDQRQEPRGSTSCITSHLNKEEVVSDSPKSLLRSKSVPVSSTVYGTRLNVEVSKPDASRKEVSKELTKAKSMKSSLKGKVSGLFFSRNKKSNKEKSFASQSKDEPWSATLETESPVPPTGKIGDDASECANISSDQEECSCPGLRGSSKTSHLDFVSTGTKHGIVSQEGGLSVAKPVMPGTMIENQDQPSPISVLEPPFEEDDNSHNTIPEPSDSIKPGYRGTEVPLKSNLIGKSPPIESVARTLSWDDSCTETASSYPVKPSLVSSGAEEKEDWLLLVQTLVSAAGLDGEVQLDSWFARWHSPESPLDPLLRDKYANVNDKELLHEARRRQRRSNRKLVFDSVNAALVEIRDHESDRSTRAMTCSGAPNRLIEGAHSMIVDYVWAQMKEWFCGEMRCTPGDGGDTNSLVVEMVVRKEVVGKGWVDNMRVELDNLRKDIEGKLLEELVEEAVVDLTGRV